MADVFISYHRSEGTSALVRRIARELESMDISCWYDTKYPNPGHFADIIEEEIAHCETFLFIWDNGANQSEWCIDEVFAALAHKKLLIPLQIGQFDKRAGLALRLRKFNIFYGGDLPEKTDIMEFLAKINDIFGKEIPKPKANRPNKKAEQFLFVPDAKLKVPKSRTERISAWAQQAQEWQFVDNQLTAIKRSRAVERAISERAKEQRVSHRYIAEFKLPPPPDENTNLPPRSLPPSVKFSSSAPEKKKGIPILLPILIILLSLLIAYLCHSAQKGDNNNTFISDNEIISTSDSGHSETSDDIIPRE